MGVCRSILRLVSPVGILPVILSLVIALVMAPVVLQAQPANETGKIAFAGGMKASTFAFDWQKGMIFVPVRINGSRQLSFVLDTGSTRILIDRRE